jgi:hypothetical protein
MTNEISPWGDSAEEQSLIKNKGQGHNEIVRIKFKEGENPIRIIGSYKFYNDHWFTSVERNAICPGKDCPMCNNPEKFKLFEQARALREQKKEKEAKETFRKAYSFDPRVQYAVNVIDRADGKVKIWAFSRTIKEKIMSFGKKYGDPTEYDIIVVRKGTGNASSNNPTKYDVIAERTNVPLTAEEKQLKVYSLNVIFKPTSVEKIQAYMRGELPEKKARPVQQSSILENTTEIPNVMEDIGNLDDLENI